MIAEASYAAVVANGRIGLGLAAFLGAFLGSVLAKLLYLLWREHRT